MRVFGIFALLMWVACPGLVFAQTQSFASDDLRSVGAFVEMVYKIPYRNAVCAFGNLDPETHAYIDKKIGDKKIRRDIYKATFGDIFSNQLYEKFENQCVDTDWAGLKPDFRTGDEDPEDDYLYSHAPALRLLGRPVIIERNQRDVRVKVIWRQIYTEGKSTRITSGRADLILLKERGLWRIDDVWVNPSSEFHDLDPDEFDRAVGTSRLREGPPPA